MDIRPETRKKFEEQGVFWAKLQISDISTDTIEKNELLELVRVKQRKDESKESARFWSTLIIAVVAAIGGWIAASSNLAPIVGTAKEWWADLLKLIYALIGR
jgi:hypothetical protein